MDESVLLNQCIPKYLIQPEPQMFSFELNHFVIIIINSVRNVKWNKLRRTHFSLERIANESSIHMHTLHTDPCAK